MLTLTTRVQHLEKRDCFPGSMVSVIRWVDPSNPVKNGSPKPGREPSNSKGKGEGDPFKNKERELVRMKWGFIPSPALKKRGVRLIFNLRADRLQETFPRLLVSQRCVVPVSGFYEWKKVSHGRGKKQGYLIRPEGRPLFSLAGVWMCSAERTTDAELEFSLITTGPNDQVAAIHNRMPVILAGEDANLWLDSGGEPGVFDELVKPYPHEMSIQALDDKKTTSQLPLFEGI